MKHLDSVGFTALSLGQFRPAPGRLTAPDVCCDIVWARGKLTLTGPATRGVPSSNVGENVTLLRLDPLVAHRWLRVPLSCFTNASVDLYDIDLRLAGELNEMKRAGRLPELIRPAGVVANDGADARVVQATRALTDGKSVGAVSREVGLSERQLERLFMQYTGLSPKTFARIQRVRAAIKAAKEGASLAVAAFAAGYADQAHFTRDVRAMAGMPPTAFIQNVGNVQDIVAGTI